MAAAFWKQLDSKRYPNRVGMAVLAVIALVAIAMHHDMWGHVAPREAIPLVAAKDLAPTTVREAHRELIRRDTGEPCHECHSDMDGPDSDPKRDVEEHKRHLRHGRNERCFNCHHADPKKRDHFVGYDGSPIPYADVVLLCAKCHGPHYREWKAGAHGRREGYWDPKKGERKTERCIACHDPHAPHFTILSAFPGPRTLHGELP